MRADVREEIPLHHEREDVNRDTGWSGSEGLGQVAGSTGSMWYTSDDHSDSVAGPQDKRNGPRSGPDARNIRYRGRADTTASKKKVPTVAKSTRGTSPHDRVTRVSGVKITPPMFAGPVPSTHSHA